MRRHVLIGALVALSSLPALADVVEQTVPMVRLEVGGVCAGPPQGAELAPDTRDGLVTKHLQPYDFVQMGDALAGAEDMGVGLVIQFQDFTPGETLTLQGQLLGVDPKPDSWTQTLRPDGLLWFGFMPNPGKPIDLGHYRFWIKRGQATLLAYDILVEPARKVEQRMLCHPDVS